jgi:hypothetical protein
MDPKLSHGWTLALLFWSVIAPLVGIFIGHLLGRSWQREQWLRDKRYEDYQAVLSGVTSAYMSIIRVHKVRETSHYTPEMVQDVERIKADSFRVLRDRIFIADELETTNISGKWDSAVTNFEMPGRDERLFADRFSQLNTQLVRMARGAPRNPGWLKRWRMRRAIAKYERGEP